MCNTLTVGDHSISIFSKTEAKKHQPCLDVQALEEQEFAGGIPASQKGAIETYIQQLRSMAPPRVNCSAGKHRSVVVAILFLNRVANGEKGSTVQELYDQVREKGISTSGLVATSLKNLGYEVKG